jgi:hypothetical protein
LKKKKNQEKVHKDVPIYKTQEISTQKDKK